MQKKLFVILTMLNIFLEDLVSLQPNFCAYDEEYFEYVPKTITVQQKKEKKEEGILRFLNPKNLFSKEEYEKVTKTELVAEKRTRTITTCCRGFVNVGNECIPKNTDELGKSNSNKKIPVTSNTSAKPAQNTEEIVVPQDEQQMSATILPSNSRNDATFSAFSKPEETTTFSISVDTTTINSQQASSSPTTLQNTASGIEKSTGFENEAAFAPKTTQVITETSAKAITYADTNEPILLISPATVPETLTQIAVTEITPEQVNPLTVISPRNDNDEKNINAIQVEKSTVPESEGSVIQTATNSVSFSDLGYTLSSINEINVDQNASENEPADGVKNTDLEIKLESEIAVESGTTSVSTLAIPVDVNEQYALSSETVEADGEAKDEKMKNLPVLVTLSNVERFSGMVEIKTKQEIVSTVDDIADNDVEKGVTTIKTLINSRKKPIWMELLQRFFSRLLKYFDRI